jgi:dimethylhistidine N-methyltransferase
MAEPIPAADRYTLSHVPSALPSLAEAVRAGLTSSPKSVPCRFFYDRRGSLLFEEICELPEYYPTRTERSILDDCAPALADCFDRPPRLVELGSGSASKTRLLIEALIGRHGSLRFAPIDISRSMLERTAEQLLEDYPQLEVHAVASDHEAGLAHLERTQEDEPQLVVWLGSSIGNFHRPEAAEFLRRVRAGMAPADRLLVGIDLRKDPATLRRAYADRDGVTARFNLNLLSRINRELDGRFDLASFEHEARWREEPGRIEMHLVSRRRQEIPIGALGVRVSFAEGESIHTESSYKYSAEEIDALARGADLYSEERWTDRSGWFSVNLFAPR